MSFDWEEIAESKRTYRAKLAALPIAEKLPLLDAMRERSLAIRNSSPMVIQEEPPSYGRKS